MWYISFLYIAPLFEWLSRLESLWFLSILATVWFSIFAIINLKEVKIFSLEIKKLKN